MILNPTIPSHSKLRKIEEFIERTKEYVPGHCDGNEYVSEKFGFKFTVDENWELYSDEDMQLASEGMKANAVTSGLAAVENEDIPQELLDKFAESIYAKAEMGALYVADYTYVGEVIVSVMSAYWMEDMSMEDYADGIKNSLDTDAQVTNENIVGNTYKVISTEITDVSGVTMTVRLYTVIKDNLLCTITCRAMEGYEELFFEAFENGISAYK